MTVLFGGLAAALAAVAIYALAGGTGARHIVVGVAALAVAAWLGSLSRAAFARRH